MDSFFYFLEEVSRISILALNNDFVGRALYGEIGSTLITLQMVNCTFLKDDIKMF